MSRKELLTRRGMLQGMLAGSAVYVGLPFLECFLNNSGTALANGMPLPTRFGTWFWGLGLHSGRWEPQKAGKIEQLGPELAGLERVKDKINVYSMMKVHTDGRPVFVHFTGNMSQLTGTVPKTNTLALPTIDALVADAIGTSTRFRSLEVTATGNAKASYSFKAGNVQQTSEASPAQVYARLFGPEFRDPNSATFTPDPKVMAEQSVLSAITDQRLGLTRQVGAADRARLDEYFTSLRQVEQQVELQLQKPAPLEACSVPPPPGEMPVGTEIETAMHTNKIMAGLLAHALACDQTRVFNMVFSEAGSALRRPGNPMTHHIYSHEESVDEQLGYQPNVSWFSTRSMEAFATVIETLDGVKEGDGTLLDHTLLLASTDTGFAKVHSLENMPVLTAGRAGGRMKTGIHVIGRGDPTTRVGLTAMQALGMSLSSWGTGSMQTSKTIGEVLV